MAREKYEAAWSKLNARLLFLPFFLHPLLHFTTILLARARMPPQLFDTLQLQPLSLPLPLFHSCAPLASHLHAHT